MFHRQLCHQNLNFAALLELGLGSSPEKKEITIFTSEHPLHERNCGLDTDGFMFFKGNGVSDTILVSPVSQELREIRSEVSGLPAIAAYLGHSKPNFYIPRLRRTPTDVQDHTPSESTLVRCNSVATR